MSVKNPIFLMMVGIPGSGKSTWISQNIDPDEYIVISPDYIRKEVTGRISDISQDGIVWETAKERVSEALQQGNNVILDATNVKAENRTRFIKDLPKCQLKAKIFFVDPEEAKERILRDIDNKVDRSHVPLDVVDSMYYLLTTESTAKQLEEEGFDLID